MATRATLLLLLAALCLSACATAPTQLALADEEFRCMHPGSR